MEDKKERPSSESVTYISPANGKLSSTHSEK